MPKVLTIEEEEQNLNTTMKSNSTSCLLSFFGLSIATSPFIFSILAFHILMEFMTELGKASEEIFRAERLPSLNFSNLERD